MTINTNISEELQKWISTLENPVEPKVTEWLKKNLGDKYFDDIDTIVIGGIGEDTMIGKYKIHFSLHVDGIQVCSSAFINSNRPYQFIIDDTSDVPLTDARLKEVEKWYTDTIHIQHYKSETK